MKKFTILFILFTVFFTVTSVIGADITSFSTGGNWSASAWPNTLRSGTISTSTTSDKVTGTGTNFLTEISVGNIIKTINNVVIGTVASIKKNDELYLVSNALSRNTNIQYNVQGVGSGDNVTIAGPVIVDVVGSACKNLIVISDKNLTTADIGGTNTVLQVNGNFIVETGATINVGGTSGGRLL